MEREDFIKGKEVLIKFDNFFLLKCFRTTFDYKSLVI